jgi:hypothetical protein
VPGRDQPCDPFSTSSDNNARRIIIEIPDWIGRHWRRSPLGERAVPISLHCPIRREIRRAPHDAKLTGRRRIGASRHERNGQALYRITQLAMP